ncbi:MAG: DUF2911 domain-containing protein [Flavobacterium sp.]
MKSQTLKLTLIFFLFINSVAWSQNKVASPVQTITGKINGANITIKYGSPSVKGRAIWGDLVPFNKVWRAGANEATTFQTDKMITINGKQLSAGLYSFFVIPNENQSVIIFNNVAKQWGANDYNASKDQLRVTVENVIGDSFAEKLEYRILQTRIELVWEKWIIGFDVK